MQQIVAVDIPSGLNSDSGFFSGDCIKANITVTFQLPKMGLLINDGPEVCGRLVVADISIPSEAVDKVDIAHYLIDETMIMGFLKPRQNNSHKGTYGKALTIACSDGMTGAGLLAARGALKSGCGISVLAVPKSIQPAFECQAVEIITIGLQDSGMGYLGEESIDDMIAVSRTCQSVLIGPGMGRQNGTKEAVKEIISQCDVPVVVDADGLNAIADNPVILKDKKNKIIITPHPGEMARLFNCNTSDIQKDRLYYAEKAAKEFDVIVVLKGFRTVIATPEGKLYINPTGNPGMATAGSGDVLAGMIVGLLAQGLDAEAAAICGVFIHGAAGDCAAKKIGEYGLTASDIISDIPHTIRNII